MYIRTKGRATAETSIPRLGPLRRPSGPPALKKRYTPRGQEGEGQCGGLGKRLNGACLDGRGTENMEGVCHEVEGCGIGGKQAGKGLGTEKKGEHVTGGWLGVLTALIPVGLLVVDASFVSFLFFVITLNTVGVPPGS